MMPPPCNEMIPPGAPRLLAEEVFSPLTGFGSSRFSLFASRAAQALAGQLDAVGVVDEAIQDGVGEGGNAEHLGMPRRLIGESLGSRSLTRSIPCMAIAIRSASGALGEDRR